MSKLRACFCAPQQLCTPLRMCSSGFIAQHKRRALTRHSSLSSVAEPLPNKEHYVESKTRLKKGVCRKNLLTTHHNNAHARRL